MIVRGHVDDDSIRFNVLIIVNSELILIILILNDLLLLDFLHQICVQEKRCKCKFNFLKLKILVTFMNTIYFTLWNVTASKGIKS